MKTLDTYRSRFGRDCKHIADETEPCWGQVRGSSRGIECVGHWGGQPYKSPEDVDQMLMLAAERQAENNALRQVTEDHQRAKREANRWFRPHIASAKRLVTDSWWQGMSDHLLCMVFSMIGEGIGSLYSDQDQWLKPRLELIGLPAIAEIARRGLPWPVGAYELKLGPPPEDDIFVYSRDMGYFPTETLILDLAPLPKESLMLWNGCAAHVVDYSCLERGVRQCIMHLWRF